MWRRVIPQICKQLEEAGIEYHADASSSLFVNGFDFEMDDFDVTVEWGNIEHAREIFSKLLPTSIFGDSPKQFGFELEGHKIDIMSYESDTGIGPQSERICVSYAGMKVWSKKTKLLLTTHERRSPHSCVCHSLFYWTQRIV